MFGPPIVAESLVSVPDPLVTALRPGPLASGADVARSLARSLRPEEDGSPPPAWLLPHQILGFRRVLAALRRYGGALLADPVGSGKTYVALAVASALTHRPVACLVPAPLVAQWRTTAARLGVPVTVGSHQQASRGRLPADPRGLVIIDESHHFRHPTTKRYRHVAPWLVGRPVVLLTATPVVNRLDDLAAQLLLAVPSDALLADGIISLRTLLTSGRPPAALGRLVFESARAGQRPLRIERSSAATPGECAAIRERLAAIDQLQLSSCPSVAALIRGVLCAAAGSSPAAFRDALRRYRALLLHARDAAAAGCHVDRAAIRRFTGEHEDQLIWWALVSAPAVTTELAPTDLETIDALIVTHTGHPTAQQPDEKLERLRRLLADGRPTLVFTTRRATVRHLRDGLGTHRVAWCTGERAGIGPTALPRETVWQWFSGHQTTDAAPRVLIATDVAAEGLDLRRIERIVHYDLPYTPMRLEQREGRALRLGSAHTTVEVIRFLPPIPLERRLKQMLVLTHKAKLPAAAGLGAAGRECWRWRAELAEQYGDGPWVAGVARVPGGPAGILAGYAIAGTPSDVLWLDRDSGDWTDVPAVVSARIAQAIASGAVLPVSGDAIHDALARLATPVRARLALRAGHRWAMPEPGPAARALAARLQTHVERAARRRDGANLRWLDRALGFLASGHTAGEEILIERVAAVPDQHLASAARRLPAPRTVSMTMEVSITGIVLFGH